jgi:hypothetical protein
MSLRFKQMLRTGLNITASSVILRQQRAVGNHCKLFKLKSVEGDKGCCCKASTAPALPSVASPMLSPEQDSMDFG